MMATQAHTAAPAFDAAAWHQSALARSLLAQCRPSEFAYCRHVAVMRDYEAWAPITGNAERIAKALQVLAENAVTLELGYFWKDFDGGEEALRWLDRWSDIPSAAEAVEIEFARRDGRQARMRWRPSAEEAEAFRAVVGAGL